MLSYRDVRQSQQLTRGGVRGVGAHAVSGGGDRRLRFLKVSGRRGRGRGRRLGGFFIRTLIRTLSVVDTPNDAPGDRITLHALEHELIRPLQEPRIHFAIVCASQSCPILQSEAYTLQHLDRQLTLAAMGFINNPKHNQFNTANRRAEMSSLFKWFEEDFVAAGGSLQAYLAPLVDNEEVADLLAQEAFEISYRKYDWNLNGTR